MSADLQNVLIGYINKFNGFVEKAIDAAMVEIPLVIKEYLQWNFWESLITGIIYFISAIAICIVFFKLASFLFKKRTRTKENSKGETKTEEFTFYEEIEDDGLKVFAGLGVLCGIILVAFFAMSLFSDSFVALKKALKIQIAPRVFLIEEAKTLYKEIQK